jgi:hypothetical protein
MPPARGPPLFTCFPAVSFFHYAKPERRQLSAGSVLGLWRLIFGLIGIALGHIRPEILRPSRTRRRLRSVLDPRYAGHNWRGALSFATIFLPAPSVCVLKH